MDTNSTHLNTDWFCQQPTKLRAAALWAACRTAEICQSVAGNRWDDGFAILMYHRVAKEISGVAAPTMNVTPEQLRRQLGGLLALGYECWPLSKLVAARREGRAIPSSAFAVTFDDGFANNYLHALPVLRELGVPGTIFVATKYLDSREPFPFDDWSAAGSSGVPAEAWRPMTTDECRAVIADGLIEIGAHTHSHEKFLGRSAEFRRDMRQCLEVLRERFGIERPTFAFPYGYKSPELVEAAKQVGVSCCLSTRVRRVMPGESEFEWGRIWTESYDTPAMLAAKMCWYPKLVNLGKPLVAAMARVERMTSRKVGNLLVGPANADLHGACKEHTAP